MEPTGRVRKGPTAVVEELRSPERGLITRIDFAQDYASHSSLTTGLHSKRPFMENPTVSGVLALDEVGPEPGQFSYRSEKLWLLREILDWARQDGKPLGVRAALELCIRVTAILEEASLMGERHGIYCHGAISPWRIAAYADGAICLLGYAIPRVDMAVWMNDGTRQPAIDSFRYSPPEQITGDELDIDSDLFSTALIAVEMITGDPLYDGRAYDVEKQATRGTGLDRMEQNPHVLTEDLRRVLGRAIRFHRDARFRDAEEFRRSAQHLLDSPLAEGDSLTEIMARLSAETAKVDGPKEMPATALRAFSAPAARAREVAVPVEPCGEVAAAPPAPEAPRWTAPAERGVRKRSRKTVADDEKEPDRAPVQQDRNPNELFPRSALGVKSRRYRVSVDGRSHGVLLDPKNTLAESAARLVDLLCPTPIELTGELIGWYRISQDGDDWFGDTRTDVLDPDRPVDLDFVRNRRVDVKFIVAGSDGAEDDRLEATIGTAVHVQFLVSALKGRLGLRGSGWGLYVEGRRLDSWQILDDYDAGDGFEIVLRRRRKSRSKGR